jgi:hypothetical protein
MKHFFSVLALLICSAIGFSQKVSVVGNPSSSSNAIIGNSKYHVSESIYTNQELGYPNFITSNTAIQKIGFVVNALGDPLDVPNFKIWMKNVSSNETVFPFQSAYTTTGYTLVYSGTVNTADTIDGNILEITLNTPFQRGFGANLQILIERLDNAIHSGFQFATANGNSSDRLAKSSREYNDFLVPVSGSTTLRPTKLRPAIQLVHVFANDAGIRDIIHPTVSCFDSNISIGVNLTNDGDNTIPAGGAQVTLKIGGANSYSATLTNSTAINSGSNEIITFTGINLDNPGVNFDTAYLSFLGDGTTFNDTLKSFINSASSLTFASTTDTIKEDVESNTLNVFPFVDLVNGNTQLWKVNQGSYSNFELSAPIDPIDGNKYFLFEALYDAEEGDGDLNTQDFVSRLYSNCISLLPSNTTGVSFFMTRDNSFSSFDDSVFVVISNDKGQTWTRLQGFGRYENVAIPYWKEEIVTIPDSYRGQTVQIGFEGVSQWGNVSGIDNIKIFPYVALPVSMMSFDAKRTGSVNNLTWVTTQETNASKFIVERSTDGRTFNEIGFVAAAGNSSTAKNYRFVDATPNKGNNYYRLKLINNDNSFRFSEIKNVKHLSFADMIVSPNPVAQNMRVLVDADKAEKATLFITDLAGRRVFNTSVNIIEGSNTLNIPVSTLNSGSYVVTIQLANQTLVKKINKF